MTVEAVHSSQPGSGEPAEPRHFSITLDLTALAQEPALDPATLRNLPLLHEVTSASLAALVRASHPRTLESGELLFSEGKPARSVFAVRSGSVAIHRSRPGFEELPLTTLHSGDWVGLFGLLAGRRRAAEARAACPCQIVEIEAAAFAHLLASDSGVREIAKRHFQHRLAKLLCGSHPLFAGLAPGDRTRLVASVHTLDLPSGHQTLLREPVEAALYVVAHGKVELTSPELPEPTVLGRGQLFGISAGSVEVSVLARCHLLRYTPADCDSPFFGELAGRARAHGLFIARHLFVGDAGIAGLS